MLLELLVKLISVSRTDLVRSYGVVLTGIRVYLDEPRGKEGNEERQISDGPDLVQVIQETQGALGRAVKLDYGRNLPNHEK